jgi:hypothetical protein
VGCDAYYSSHPPLGTCSRKRPKRTTRMRGRRFLCEPCCSHPLYFRGLRLVEKTFIPMTTTIIKASIIRVRENKGQNLRLHSSRIPPVVAGGGRGCRPSLSLQNYCWRGFAKAKSLHLLHNNELTTTQPTYGCFHRGQTIYWRIIWSHKLVMIPFAIIILSLFLHACQNVTPNLIPSTHSYSHSTTDI